MQDGDHPAADGGGKREARADGGDSAPAATSGAAEPTAAGQAEAATRDGSDSDSYSWTSSEDGEDLADDAVPAAALAGVDPGSVVPFGLADPRRHLSPAPTFGNVAVANSTDVQFGNKTFFNGPVTIKQVVYAKDVEGAAATAVPAAGTGASVAHVDPAAPDKSAVVAEGVRLKVLHPVVVANGKAPRPNGAVPSTSNESVTGTNCCEIPGFSGAGKPGEEEGAGRGRGRCLWMTSRRCNTVLCVAAAVLVVAGATLTVSSSLLTSRYSAATARPDQPELPKPWETAETNETLNGTLTIIPRTEWQAEPRADAPDFLQLPVHYVIISHSASEGCNTQDACTEMVRFIQTFHIKSRHWSDIAYNFLVGGDGSAYEGRGWNVIGAHTYGYNSRSIGLNMIGTFIKELPSKAQLLALRQLIQLGVNEGYIAENYKLLAHRQLSATESPGTRLYEELQKWPHWSPKP